jgi:hypothetical protein
MAASPAAWRRLYQLEIRPQKTLFQLQNQQQTEVLPEFLLATPARTGL